MSHNHECVSCTGTKYDGANLKCQLCYKPYFLECIANVNKNEIMELICSLKPANNNVRLQTKLQKMFGDDSMLMFVCMNCKPNHEEMKTEVLKCKRIKSIEKSLQIERETVANLMQRINTLETDLLSSNEIKTNINEQNIALQNELHTLKIQFNALSEKNAQLHQQIEHENEMDTNIDTNIETIDLNNANSNEVKTWLKNELIIFKRDIEQKMITECNKIKADMNSICHVNEQSAKRKKTNNAQTAKKTPINGFLPVNMDEINQNSELLRPPSDEMLGNERDVYEVHVSKFHPDQSEEKIAMHICKNTRADEKSFRVIKLFSKKMPIKNNNYVSFKIITLNKDVYNVIMDPQLWHGYEVREFEHEKMKNMVNTGNWNKKMYYNRSTTNTFQNRYNMGRKTTERNIYHNRPKINEMDYQNVYNETPRRPKTPLTERVKFNNDNYMRSDNYTQYQIPPRFSRQQNAENFRDERQTNLKMNTPTHSGKIKMRR